MTAAHESVLRGRVLVVDDDERVRALLARVLELGGYSCALAGGAEEARALLGDGFDLVLTDIQMPGESGLDFITHVAQEYPDTATVMVTGIDDAKLAEVALELGTYGYIIKPFKPNELLINVANALRRRKLELESKESRSMLARTVLERTMDLRETVARLQHSERELRLSREETIHRLARAIEFHDPETGLHIEQMARYCELLAGRLGFDAERCKLIRVASPLHDVGKIGIPESVLFKPAALTPEEEQVMQQHAELGYRMLAGSSSEMLQLAATIALTHHERVDGTGYPRGLKGQQIPLEGRIAAVADTFAAITTDRRYRTALPADEAFQVMWVGRGSQFDDVVVDALLEASDDVLAILLLAAGPPSQGQEARAVESSARGA